MVKDGTEIAVRGLAAKEEENIQLDAIQYGEDGTRRGVRSATSLCTGH